MTKIIIDSGLLSDGLNISVSSFNIDTPQLSVCWNKSYRDENLPDVEFEVNEDFEFETDQYVDIETHNNLKKDYEQLQFEFDNSEDQNHILTICNAEAIKEIARLTKELQKKSFWSSKWFRG